MHFRKLVTLALTLCGPILAQGQTQTVLADDHGQHVINIAIIGAGAGGASSAYFLQKYASKAGIPINITVFERNPYIGGRSTTVNAYQDPKFPVELGASIFVEVNSILVNAVEEFNLSTSGFISQSRIPGAALAVWNGEKFVVTQNTAGGWWDIAKLLWKYGLAPIKTMNLVKAVINKFLAMYEEPAFPFTSLSQVAQDVGLLAVSAATGEQYMEENGITGDFGRDVVQASTRVNYAQNLNYIHGLEAMVSMAAENARSVQGGNWQIFAGMIKAAKATVLLETAVTAIEKKERGGYKVHSESAGIVSGDKRPSQHFDSVILATPYQFSNISSTLDSQSLPDAIPYVELHVTLFTSPHLLSPKFFDPSSNEPAPRVILTTLPKQEKARTGPEGVGSPGFFSISLLQPLKDPKTGGEEYLYKIFSASPITPKFLADLLGLDQKQDSGESEITDRDVTWIFRKLWNSYPYVYPRVTFDKIQLDDNLWYTGVMDSFISTMETNALMGRNVARLVVDGWLASNKAAAWEGAIDAALLMSEL